MGHPDDRVVRSAIHAGAKMPTVGKVLEGSPMNAPAETPENSNKLCETSL